MTWPQTIKCRKEAMERAMDELGWRARVRAAGSGLAAMLGCACCWFLLSGHARAADADMLTVGGGLYDVTDDRTTSEFRVEYTFGGEELAHFVGAMATGDGAAYVYTGVTVDLELSENLLMTPNLATGLYSDGDGKRLGHVVQFRSGVTISYRFDNDSRIGVAAHHTSNAGLGSNNQGVETVMLLWSMPVDTLPGR